MVVMITGKANDTIRDVGFAIIDNLFSSNEIDSLSEIISKADPNNESFRKSNTLYAIRQFLKELPATRSIIFSHRLVELISQIFGDDYFITKSIYFNKPEDSNWFVSYHQDLTISVNKKIDLSGYINWTKKNNQFAVQPPLQILENNFTLRIHLDDTNEENGALKVIPKSHLKGVYRPEKIDWAIEKEVSCNVAKGGMMIMRPLLLHSSGRTTNNQKRRVIHIEFSNQTLPEGLLWSELDRY